jgi:hypothetical protein
VESTNQIFAIYFYFLALLKQKIKAWRISFLNYFLRLTDRFHPSSLANWIEHFERQVDHLFLLNFTNLGILAPHFWHAHKQSGLHIKIFRKSNAGRLQHHFFLTKILCWKNSSVIKCWSQDQTICHPKRFLSFMYCKDPMSWHLCPVIKWSGYLITRPDHCNRMAAILYRTFDNLSGK